MPEASLRIKPALGHDNAWWWEHVQQKGTLGIQACRQCQQLRHPPRPMCSECHSLDWDVIPATGKGTICSYTVLHHPKFPGYDYPLIIALIDLAEGIRYTSQIIDCEPDQVDFGQSVEMVIHTDPDGFVLPVFRVVGLTQSSPSSTISQSEKNLS